MVAEKTSKLEGNQFFLKKIPYIICENEISTNVSKAKRIILKANMDNKCRKANRTTNATLQFWNGNFFLIAPFPDVCLLLPFHALVDVNYVCVACLSLG